MPYAEQDARTVVLRYRPSVPAAGVDLLGEMETWLTPVPMTVWEGQTREATLELAPGVYAYKYRHADGSYHLDPAHGRTLNRDGAQNSVLVVAGTPEPLLHAPRAPYLWEREDGLLCVRAALRRTAGAALSVRWDEGHGSQLTAMRRVGEEHEHWLFEALLPASSERTRYLFALPSGELVGSAGEHGAAFVHVRPARRSALAEWWKHGVMYSIFVDRFRRGGGKLGTPAHERARAGGDLWGVIEALPYLSDLGVTMLQLTPIALSPSAHRYDAIDPRVVDPALGGERALTALLEAAHARGMRVLLDIACSHVHRDHAAFRELRALGPRSPYWAWFQAYAFPFAEGPDGGYLHYPKGQWEEPLLRTDNPDVQRYLVGHFEHFARMGVDGFRVDAACSLPLTLTHAIREAVLRIRPDALVWGEITVDNAQRWLAASALDSATDFVAQAAERRFWRGELDARALSALCNRRRFYRAGTGTRALAFTANHDQARLLTLHGDASLARAAHVLLLSRAELPALYYGDELELASEQRERNWEDAWPDRAPMPWERAQEDVKSRELVRELVKLRRASSALTAGEERWLVAEDPEGGALADVLVLRRESPDEQLDVLLSRAPHMVRVRLPEAATAHAEMVLASAPARLAGDTLELPPRSAVIVRRSLAPAVQALWEGALNHAAELARAAFVSGATEVPALPERLYLTMTERCNLRCAHCITHAPRLTREGRARSLEPWLLPRLRDAFQAMSYLGFVHGGESLVAPGFFATLAYVQRARARVHGRLDIHLLSNGMLLDEERVQRLVDAGVTSLAVSLDGASPHSNDKLRIGGSFHTVVKHLERALALRARRAADLRIGISCVVGKSSLPELESLARLCVELGVDWLKLEEMYGATGCAAQELVPAGDARLLDALGRVRAQLEHAGVVFVDHTHSKPACACASDPCARAFREADDFANRAQFRPCRMLWEQAAVDPDGVVRPVDYAHGALGSLREAELLALWNGEVMQAARARILTPSTRAQRERCVAGEPAQPCESSLRSGASSNART